ncbi:MFS transporter [Streptomyces sp. NPDC047046]|uniref:MFS transporter n=1 Tax=Streptomyces sp. NPDC047046 TaxID=3155378 RepID=UPI00340B8BB1
MTTVRPAIPRASNGLGAATACYALAMSVFGTTTSLFLTDGSGAGPGRVGLYFVLSAVVSVGLGLTVGRWSDRLTDRRNVLVMAALAGVAGAGGFALVRQYALVCAIGALLGGLAQTYASQVFAYARELSELTGRSLTRGTASVRAVFSAGWVLGPPAGLFLLTRTGFGALYGSLAALLLLSALLARWVLPRVPRARTTPTKLRLALGQVPRHTWLLLGAATAVNVADGMYLIALAPYATHELGLSATLVGLLAGTCAALEIPLLIGVGRLAGRLGEERLVRGAAVLAVAFFALMPFAASGPYLLLLQVPNALWTAVLVSLPMVLVQREIPGGAGTAAALFSATFPLAQLLSGGLTGLVATHSGYRGTFWCGAALCALAWVLIGARRRA